MLPGFIPENITNSFRPWTLSMAKPTRGTHMVSPEKVQTCLRKYQELVTQLDAIGVPPSGREKWIVGVAYLMGSGSARTVTEAVESMVIGHSLGVIKGLLL
jgi:hypothetical protein